MTFIQVSFNNPSVIESKNVRVLIQARHPVQYEAPNTQAIKKATTYSDRYNRFSVKPGLKC